MNGYQVNGWLGLCLEMSDLPLCLSDNYHREWPSLFPILDTNGRIFPWFAGLDGRCGREGRGMVFGWWWWGRLVVVVVVMEGDGDL